ncbi:Putative DNA-binding protein ESCAROLA [Apostasia shenzhenica]|uniref:DNA-binding protein ESCAROLA n=1 Tax=Apostasia shenzhenica TaxID=1088818 RepID=A0A2I0AM55_9ASPA|nr:Putative DNA-binding protein ESCAROLA [Apostasia shenzhenica]
MCPIEYHQALKTVSFSTKKLNFLNMDDPFSHNLANADSSPDPGDLRRWRGRPPNSRSKPNQPAVVVRDGPSALRSHVLEVADGADVIESVASYARRRGRGVSVIAASGAVAGITLRSPPPETLPGRFEILSLTGTVLPPPAPPESGGLAVLAAAGEGRVVGGRVGGPLVAAGPVVLTVAAFASAVCERLPPASTIGSGRGDGDYDGDGDGDGDGNGGSLEWFEEGADLAREDE